MSGSEPTVSVFVAVRDGGKYLREAIDSILGQTRPPEEVVVVNDGSTDDTAEILASYGDALRVFHQEASGYPVTFNRGFAQTTGDLLACLDADDYWELDAIERRYARLMQPDAPDAVAGMMVQFLSPELDGSDGRRFRFDTEPVRTTLFQSTITRRAMFDRVGMLDETLMTSANIDWMSRARAAGMTLVHVDAVVLHRRIHRTNMGIRLADQKQTDLLRIVRAHHERFKAEPPSEADE